MKNLKFPICLFWDKLDIEIMSEEKLVKEKVHLDKYILILHGCHTEILCRG